MKTISAELATHVSQEVTTLATCWKITRQDAQVFGFTDHERDLTVSGVTYLASTGYQASAVQTGQDLSVDNLDITGILDAATIAEADLLAGVWDYAEVIIFRINYNAVSDGPLYLRRGWLGEVRLGSVNFVAELRGLTQSLQQTVGEVYSAACRADLFDARCGLAAASYKVTGTVTSVTDRSTFRDTSRTEVEDYFGGGKITWTSGANSGRSMEIKSHTAATDEFVLSMPMVETITVGDAYDMWPGCRKRAAADCQTKFGNIVNFRGEPYVPGLDSITKGVG